jgi:hypothetical protein
MNSEPSKLRHEQRAVEEQNQRTIHEQAQTHGKEFASVDELLRYDSEVHPVPAEVGERLSETLAAEPKPQRPWYKRLFGA